MYGLALENLPLWMDNAFRYFEKHERHMTRRFNYMCALVIIFDGVLRFVEDGELVEVSAGEYYIQRYCVLQEGKVECDSPKYFFVHFRNATFLDSENTLPLRGKADLPKLFPLFKELETLRITNASLVDKTATFYKILSVLQKGSEQKGRAEIIEKVVSMVTEDIRSPFSLEAVSARCGYSKSQIINIFKQETGKTPYAFINDMKIKMAQQLLLNSDSSLASIGAECGFGSYTNLYRCFLREVGCSPAEWKKEHRTLQKFE